MSKEDHLSWLASAVDALDGISASEVAAISVEIRRSITRINQIVPAIADKVAEKRRRSTQSTERSPFAAEMAINREAQQRRAKAKSQAEVEDAWQWERSARQGAGLHVPPIEKPLSRFELESLPSHVVRMGLETGFLKRDGNALVETPTIAEIDRIRDVKRAGR